MKALNDILITGVGGRKEEGFGQIRPWVLHQSFKIESDNKAPKVEVNITELSDDTKELMETIFATMDVEAVRAQAYQDVKNHEHQLSKADNHTFARLENYVSILANQTHGISDDDKNALKRIFQDNWSANGLFLVYQQTESTCDVENALIKYEVPEWVITLGETHQGLRELVYGVDDTEQEDKQKKLFFEAYWTWFFKYARKL